MTIDDVVAKATINFPSPLSEEQMRALLGYLWKNGNLEVNYKLEIGERTGNRFDTLVPHDQAVVTSLGVSGTIFDTQTHAFDTFNGEQIIAPRDDKPYIANLKFFIVPGWDLQEYRPEVLRLWDRTRTLTEQYFGEKF